VKKEKRQAVEEPAGGSENYQQPNYIKERETRNLEGRARSGGSSLLVGERPERRRRKDNEGKLRKYGGLDQKLLAVEGEKRCPSTALSLTFSPTAIRLCTSKKAACDGTSKPRPKSPRNVYKVNCHLPKGSTRNQRKKEIFENTEKLRKRLQSIKSPTPPVYLKFLLGTQRGAGLIES